MINMFVYLMFGPAIWIAAGLGIIKVYERAEKRGSRARLWELAAVIGFVAIGAGVCAHLLDAYYPFVPVFQVKRALP